MRCDKCRKQAVIHQPYSGLNLCREHFITDVEAKAKRAIRTHGWLQKNDHIGVILSGRSADEALLQFLVKLTGRRRDVTLSAIIISDLNGGDALRQPGPSADVPAGVACIPVYLSDECGAGSSNLQQDISAGDAVRTSLLRQILRQTAKQQGVTKLASSASLEDVAESVLRQVLAGAPDRLLRLPAAVAGEVIDIRPFMHVPFGEVCLYSDLTLGRSDTVRPAIRTDTFLADTRDLLSEYSGRHPSAPYSLVSLCEQLASGRRHAGRRGDPVVRPVR